ncbi:HAMP domain-containing protein [Actinomadura barringtoniae]|uniref:histidine kinase n=1 Tax=Actinomadura barringtoniae TaxID=1427535 RepID=A0A939P736_9ACTN|nr:ATP-binding protein [Actinomadura barringtoniae]MBO2446831.1 HAMP domain-containing protein [Actinomadura barringtoniae]
MRIRWPRSIRARVTIAAVGVVGALLLAAVLVTAGLLTELIKGHLRTQAAQAARQVAVQATTERLPDPIPAQNGVLLIQVVSDKTGTVVAASAPLRGKPPMTTIRPTGDDTRVDGRLCQNNDLVPDCALVTGFDIITEPYGDAMVYAAVAEPWLLGNHVLEGVMGGLCLVVLCLVGWAIWAAVGRTLRPVAQIEGEMAEITASDLSRRMPVPDSDDEVARLASTLNATLDRLEAAVGQQRRFVSDASHELRTPITGLRTRVEFALEDPDDTDLVGTLKEALLDAERLHGIVEDLLALARLDSGVAPAREPLDLGAVAAAEVDRRPARVPVTTRLDPGVMVEGNRLQLARLLVNLLANADRHAARAVEVVVRADGDEAVLEVRDDGPGIAEADRERIFERFTRLDAARSRDAGGTGLGLPIARDIAAAHGGRLYVGDRADGALTGARLILRLPLHP